MVQVTVEEASQQFAHLLDVVGSGEEVVITRDDTPLALLSSINSDNGLLQRNTSVNSVLRQSAPRQPGSAKDIVLYIADDFDAPLEDFRDYM